LDPKVTNQERGNGSVTTRSNLQAPF